MARINGTLHELAFLERCEDLDHRLGSHKGSARELGVRQTGPRFENGQRRVLLHTQLPGCKPSSHLPANSLIDPTTMYSSEASWD